MNKGILGYIALATFGILLTALQLVNMASGQANLRIEVRDLTVTRQYEIVFRGERVQQYAIGGCALFLFDRGLLGCFGRLSLRGELVHRLRALSAIHLDAVFIERFVFLLPGNPVSCLCAYEFFAGPTLRRLGGRSAEWPHRRVRLPLARKISSAIGRVDYVRVAVEDGLVVPLATSGASILISTVRATGAVIVPRGLEGMPDGAEVEVLLYDSETAEMSL